MDRYNRGIWATRPMAAMTAQLRLISGRIPREMPASRQTVFNLTLALIIVTESQSLTNMAFK